jgi:hypothetical protein
MPARLQRCQTRAVVLEQQLTHLLLVFRETGGRKAAQQERAPNPRRPGRAPRGVLVRESSGAPHKGLV